MDQVATQSMDQDALQTNSLVVGTYGMNCFLEQALFIRRGLGFAPRLQDGLIYKI